MSKSPAGIRIFSPLPSVTADPSAAYAWNVPPVIADTIARCVRRAQAAVAAADSILDAFVASPLFASDDVVSVPTGSRAAPFWVYALLPCAFGCAVCHETNLPAFHPSKSARQPLGKKGISEPPADYGGR